MNVYTNSPRAYGYTPRQSRAAFNTDVAAAHQASDPRIAMKALDAAGQSRSAGQKHIAGIASAQSLASGVAQAYQRQLEDQVQNDQINLGNDVSAESLGLGVGGLAQQDYYSNLMANLQRQRSLQGGALGGLLGGDLDSFLGF